MLHRALIEQRPVAVQRVTPQIFERDEHGRERQQAEPYELPLPADVESESDEAPVTAAAMPNHIRKMPGDMTSSANRIAARIIQVHGPSVKRPLIVAAPYTEGTPPADGRAASWSAGCLEAGYGGEAELPPRSPKASRAISATPAMAPITEAASSGSISTFWFVASARAFSAPM